MKLNLNGNYKKNKFNFKFKESFKIYNDTVKTSNDDNINFS